MSLLKILEALLSNRQDLESTTLRALEGYFSLKSFVFALVISKFLTKEIIVKPSNGFYTSATFLL